MDTEKENTNTKKIYAILTSIIVCFILVKVFGIDFFLLNFTTNFSKYDIKIHQLDELIKTICVSNLKSMIIILFMLRLKHGQIYKNIIVSLVTVACICVIINVFESCNNIFDSISAIIMYLPQYINYYIYIIVQENIDIYINQYNSCKTIKDEIKPLLVLFIAIVSTTIVLSFIQSMLSVVII